MLKIPSVEERYAHSHRSYPLNISLDLSVCHYGFPSQLRCSTRVIAGFGGRTKSDKPAFVPGESTGSIPKRVDRRKAGRARLRETSEELCCRSDRTLDGSNLVAGLRLAHVSADQTITRLRHSKQDPKYCTQNQLPTACGPQSKRPSIRLK